MKKSFIVILVVAALIASYFGFRKGSEAVTTESKAIEAVKNTYPEYEDYPSDNLPPKSVEAVKVEEGFRVGMYMEGSGLKGILKANCFLVTKEGVVTETGQFGGEGPAESLNLATCTPKK